MCGLEERRRRRRSGINSSSTGPVVVAGMLEQSPASAVGGCANGTRGNKGNGVPAVGVKDTVASLSQVEKLFKELTSVGLRGEEWKLDEKGWSPGVGTTAGVAKDVLMALVVVVGATTVEDGACEEMGGAANGEDAAC